MTATHRLQNNFIIHKMRVIIIPDKNDLNALLMAHIKSEW